MEISIKLTDKEIIFLKRMIIEMNGYKQEQLSMEDAVHECIRMAAYEESEEAV